ncbi:MAG TPA: 2Fe-2S iron-sulfur cluster-binding protein [Symbiobacteriaceae bacterium]|nr:2Fe-2S iron-sulfur cluster-binding protein [Symbiobacteriaceae bacterium]
MPTITFQPMGKRFEVAAGTTVLEVAMQHEIFLRHVCGGKAMCATCRCKVIDGADKLSPMARHEEKRLKELYAPKGVRLSCQAEIRGDVVVEVPVPTLGL